MLTAPTQTCRVSKSAAGTPLIPSATQSMRLPARADETRDSVLTNAKKRRAAVNPATKPPHVPASAPGGPPRYRPASFLTKSRMPSNSPTQS